MRTRPIPVRLEALCSMGLSALDGLDGYVEHFFTKNGDRYKRENREKFAKLPVQSVQPVNFPVFMKVLGGRASDGFKKNARPLYFCLTK